MRFLAYKTYAEVSMMMLLYTLNRWKNLSNQLDQDKFKGNYFDNKLK